MIQAVIFDLDGVLVRSEEKTFELLQRIARLYGFRLSDQLYPQRIGKKIGTFLDGVGRRLSRPTREHIVEEFYREYRRNPARYITPIEETTDALRKYRGSKRLGLASVGSFEDIRRVLGYIGLASRFQVILSSEDVVRLKPDPEIYLRAAERIGYVPKLCAAVEDSHVGVEAAVSAGLKSYVFLNGINSKRDFRNLPVSGFLSTREDVTRILG